MLGDWVGVAVDGIWVGGEEGLTVGLRLPVVCWHWNTGHEVSGVTRHASPKRDIT